MGEIKTPRPHYFERGVVEFFVKDKQVNYRVVHWSEDGLVQFPLTTGVYHGDVDQIVKEALQNFSKVSGN